MRGFPFHVDASGRTQRSAGDPVHEGESHAGDAPWMNRQIMQARLQRFSR
jgi:hypothetical protein